LNIFTGYCLVSGEKIEDFNNFTELKNELDLESCNVMLAIFGYPLLFWSVLHIVEVFAFDWQVNMLHLSSKTLPAQVFLVQDFGKLNI
jgi:hypothetical protein